MQSDDHFNNLSRAVSINENLKDVIEISRQINLVAINAILVAKRAGVHSSGFRVVAMELRTFSSKIEEVMDKLAHLIADLVKRVAQLLKLKRRMGAITRTIHACQHGEQRLQQKVDEKEAEYHNSWLLAKEQWEVLKVSVHRTLSLCSSGSMLSHNARIEASYGGEMVEEMHQVATEIERILQRAINSLKQLNNIFIYTT